MSSAEKYYGICLEDYALPGMCTGSKLFYGTIDQIEHLIDSLGDGYGETSAAFQTFKQGDSDATHVVAYSKQKLMQPVDLIAHEQLRCPPSQWDHRNVWGFVYSMRFETAHAEQILIFHNGKYIRAVKPTFTNLRYCVMDAPEGLGWLEIGSFWGFPNMLTRTENQIKCALFVEEQIYDDLPSAMADMGDVTKMDFTQTLNEVFADG